MKAVILAAGYGTRLYPLTKNKSKSLIEVAGKPLIEHILIRVEEVQAINQIMIITNAIFYRDLLEWQKTYPSKIPIKILNDGTSSNETRLGAIGDIHFAITHEKIEGDIMVIGGDNLFDYSLSALENFFRKKNSSVVALYDIKDKSKAAGKYGIVHTDQNNKIIDFQEKPSEPKTSLVSTACYILSKADLHELEECIRKNNKPDNLGDFIKYLSQKKHIYGCIFSEKWFDIGSHEQLKEADEFWQKKREKK